MQLTPPHDISGKRIGEHLPKGAFAEELTDLIVRANKLLSEHPVNKNGFYLVKIPPTAYGSGDKAPVPRLKSSATDTGFRAVWSAPWTCSKA